MRIISNFHFTSKYLLELSLTSTCMNSVPHQINRLYDMEHINLSDSPLTRL